MVVEVEGDPLMEGEGDRQMVCPMGFLLEEVGDHLLEAVGVLLLEEEGGLPVEAEGDLSLEGEGGLEVEQGVCLEGCQMEKSL